MDRQLESYTADRRCAGQKWTGSEREGPPRQTRRASGWQAHSVMEREARRVCGVLVTEQQDVGIYERLLRFPAERRAAGVDDAEAHEERVRSRVARFVPSVLSEDLEQRHAVGAIGARRSRNVDSGTDAGPDWLRVGGGCWHENGHERHEDDGTPHVGTPVIQE